MTDEELAAIKARCKTATPGPWTNESNDRTGDYRVDSPHGCIVGGRVRGYCDGEGPAGLPGDLADAAFIAAARTDIPRLLAELERARAALRVVGCLSERNGMWRCGTDGPHMSGRCAVCDALAGDAGAEEG